MRLFRLAIVVTLAVAAVSCKKGGGYLKTAPEPVMQR
jgi:hypothetical protein